MNNQALPFFQFNNPQAFMNPQAQMNLFNIEQLKSKYVTQNPQMNNYYNKAFTMNPSTNSNFLFGIQDNTRYNQNPINNFNTISPIPQMQMNHINNTMLVNPRDEIERIKMKYFSIENANNVNAFTNTLSTIEDKIKKYKDEIYSSPNDPISVKYNKQQNVKPSSNRKLEINRVNDIEINTNDNNELLLSKVSWIEGKISTSSNKFNFNNNSINMLEQNKNNDITTNQNVSYTYSNSCKSEKEENEENYNYDEVLPIIDKVSKLKQIEHNEEYNSEEEEEDNHKKISKQIVNNVIDEVSSKLSEKSEREEENKVDYLNVKDLEVDNVNTTNKKEISQPKVITTIKKQSTLPKKKLISFEEFLSLNDE